MTTNEIRALMGEGTVFAPGVFNAATAETVERCGFSAMYMTGFGTAANYGFPDVGLVSQTEMAANVERITTATSVPLIADADTGYGSVINVARTVNLWERSGAAALHLEDQTFPKKCGFMQGKSVVDLDEYLRKLRAALDARSGDGDEALVVIARTDALAPHGWDEAERRVLAFHEAGADVVFVDGIRTLDDLDQYVRRVVERGVPALYNGMLRGPQEIAQMAFAIQLHAGAALGAVANCYLGDARSADTTPDALAASTPRRPGRAFDGFTAKLVEHLGFETVLVDLADVDRVLAGSTEEPPVWTEVVRHVRYLADSVSIPVEVTGPEEARTAKMRTALEHDDVRWVRPDRIDADGPNLHDVLADLERSLISIRDGRAEGDGVRDDGRFETLTSVLGLPRIYEMEAHYASEGERR